jgi:hypothetical protein
VFPLGRAVGMIKRIKVLALGLQSLLNEKVLQDCHDPLGNLKRLKEYHAFYKSRGVTRQSLDEDWASKRSRWWNHLLFFETPFYL